MMRLLSFLVLGLGLAAGGEVRAGEDDVGAWVHDVGRDNPLVGRIWSVRKGRFLEERVLVRRLRKADAVLLGESHDNADHHRLQARLIRVLHPDAVAFEMLDGQGELQALSTDALRVESGWDDSGWPAFGLYEPVFEATLQGGSRILQAHPTDDELKQVMEGAEPPAVQGVPVQDYPAEALRSLRDEIVASHCGHASEPMIEAMIPAQALKDRHLAAGVLRGGRGAVLVAGNGHIREDRGVPWQLGTPVATVAMTQVRPGETAPSAYGRDEAGQPLYDYLWFTPAVTDADPCERFREQLEQMRSR